MNDTQNTDSLNGMKFELELFWRKKNTFTDTSDDSI